MYIYLIKNNLNNKYYVGQTTQKRIERRWQSHYHVKKNLKNLPPIMLAISKYGKDNFTFSVLASCSSRAELDELERKYIAEYNSLAPNGYNLMAGGTSGYVFHEETLKKMSEIKKGSVLPEETKNKMSESHKKRWQFQPLRDKRSEQSKQMWQDARYREKIVKSLYKRWESKEARDAASKKAKEQMTEEQKHLISQKVKESLLDPAAKAKLNAAHKRQQRRVVDDLGNIFESLKDAASFYGMNSTSAIIKQIKGKYKTAGGRTFKYLD